MHKRADCTSCRMKGISDALEVRVGDLVLLRGRGAVPNVTGYVAAHGPREIVLSHEDPASPHRTAFSHYRNGLGKGDRKYLLSDFESYRVLETRQAD